MSLALRRIAMKRATRVRFLAQARRKRSRSSRGVPFTPSFGRKSATPASPPQTLRFESRAEIPVIHGGVEFAAERLCGKQRGRAINDSRFRIEVDAILLHAGLQQQPALVDRSAGNAEQRPFRSARVSIGEAAGTITAPSALESG